MNTEQNKKDYFEVTVIKSNGFKIACLGILLLSLIPIFRTIFVRYDQFLGPIPVWLPYFSITIGILEIVASILIYNFKKIGIYLFVFALCLDILTHLFLGIYEMDIIHGLYFFIGFALVPIVPRWKYFK